MPDGLVGLMLSTLLENLVSQAPLLIVFVGMFSLVWRALSIAHDLSKLALQKPQASPVPAAPITQPPQSTAAPAPVKSAPTADRFAACMAFVWPEEGGFSNDPQDHGGPTNLGVTLPDLERAGLPATMEELKSLTKDSAAAQIYRPFYWNAMHCDELPAGVDLEVFDLGINAGIHEAAKLLQRAVGAVADGVIGPQTIAAVQAKAPLDIINAFNVERVNFYKALKQFDRFGRDWLKRSADCYARSTKMATSN